MKTLVKVAERAQVEVDLGTSREIYLNIGQNRVFRQRDDGPAFVGS
jgi:hypothetical protein